MRLPPRKVLLVALALAIAVEIAVEGWLALRTRSREIAGGLGRGQAVIALEPAEVVSVRATRGAASADAPPGAAADRVVGAVAALRRRATLAAGADADLTRTSGLGAPRVAVTLLLRDGRSLELALGLTTGADGVTFVRAPDRSIVVVAADAALAVERAADALLAGDR